MCVCFFFCFSFVWPYTHICLRDHCEIRREPSFQRPLFTSDICSKRNTHFICYGIANFNAESKVNQTGNDFDTHDVCVHKGMYL